MSESLATALAPLVLSSEAADYGAVGFHHRHTSTTAALPAITEAFLGAGYILEMMTCEDRREATQKMRLCYTFNRLEAVDRHLLQAELDPDTEEAPSVSALVGAANWFEREVYDMYGVRFTGHPYLVRILLPEDVDFFALRKDFGRMQDAEGASDSEAADDE